MIDPEVFTSLIRNKNKTLVITKISTKHSLVGLIDEAPSSVLTTQQQIVLQGFCVEQEVVGAARPV